MLLRWAVASLSVVGIVKGSPTCGVMEKASWLLRGGPFLLYDEVWLMVSMRGLMRYLPSQVALASLGLLLRFSDHGRALFSLLERMGGVMVEQVPCPQQAVTIHHL